jgi:predicted TIM-barrel fold metal-dependent hydrolase
MPSDSRPDAVLGSSRAAASGPADLDRRRLIALAGAAGVAATTPKGAFAKEKPVSLGKIDTHLHFFPKVYVDAVGLDTLASQMPNKRAPEWSPELAIAMMDDNGIAEGILSVSSGPPIPDAPRLLQACNEAAADLRARYKGRFGSFASLPLPDVDASLKEIEHAFDDLKADGVIVFASYDGHYLGEPLFAPVLAELNRRKAVVFIHPNQPPYAVPPIAPASVLEFPFETARTATSLIVSGALKTYPNIRFILSHAGGVLPYLVPRLTLSFSMMPGVAERVGDAAEAFRTFYYDTALSAGPAVFAALEQVASPERITFGSDFPMAPVPAISAFNAELERLRPPLRDAVYRHNAARLLGRT